MMSGNALQDFPCPGTDIAPVRRDASRSDECVTKRIILDRKLLEQVRIKQIPEAVVRLAVMLEESIELLLGFAFQGYQLFRSGN